MSAWEMPHGGGTVSHWRDVRRHSSTHARASAAFMCHEMDGPSSQQDNRGLPHSRQEWPRSTPLAHIVRHPLSAGSVIVRLVLPQAQGGQPDRRRLLLAAALQHVCHVVDPEPGIELEIAIWQLPQLPLRGRRGEVVEYGVGVLKKPADLLVGVRARLENAGHRRSESVDTRVVAVLPLERRDVAVLEQDRVGGQAVFARSAHGASLPLVATPASTVSPEARSTSATSRTSWAAVPGATYLSLITYAWTELSQYQPRALRIAAPPFFRVAPRAVAVSVPA